MKHRKLFALLLAACMVLSILPAVAFADETTDTIDKSFTGANTTSFITWSKNGTSGAAYAGNSAGGNDSVQLRSNNSNSGIVTTGSAGTVKKISVTWNSNTTNGRTLNVYGKDTAYSAATDLYNSSNQGTLLGTIVKGTSTELVISGEYAYIGLRSASGAMYLEKIEIIWETEGSGTEPTPTPTATPEPTFTDMTLKRVPSNGDVVVIYYPAASKVMTAEDYYYNNKKYELVAADATLTDDVLAVPEEAARLTVSVDADNKYTFATADGKYLMADGTNVQLVDEQGANTLFRLETAAAGTDNYYIKCDSASYNGKAQYIEYYSGYFTVYGMGTNTAIYTFQFFSENGEGPTPEAVYTVSFDANGGSGTMDAVTDATSPFTLPENGFTAPEGQVFAGWKMDGDDTVYAPGAEVAITGDVTFRAQWKVLVTRSYTLITSAEDLTAGDTYIVVGINEDKAYALAQQWANNRRAAEIMLEGDKALVDVDIIATEAVDQPLVYELTLGGDAENGWTFFDPLNNGYLYAAGSGNNLRTQETNDLRGVFTLTFGEDGAVVAASQGEDTNKYFRFNSQGLFSCYKENFSVQNPIYLYRLDTEVVPSEPAFRTVSLLLSGQIGVKFHMDLPEIEGVDYSESYMTFAIEHGPVTERAELDGDGFTCFVNAMQMAEPITATFHYGDGLTIEKTYSVADYFKAFDEAVDDGTITDEKLITLAHSVADYGHYVQIFQAGIKGWTLSEHYAEMNTFYAESYDIDAIKTAVADYAIVKNITGGDITAITHSLIVDSETAIRVYFKVNTSYNGAFDVVVDGETYTAARSGSKYMVEITNVKASKLADTHTIQVTTDNGEATVNVSGLSYVKSMLDAYNTEAPQYAACAIYAHATAAQSYLTGRNR